MQDQPWFPRTEFEKLHYGRGKSDGKSEGMAKGMAKSILRIFAGRQVQVDEETQRRLLACTDEELLSELIDRALTATVAADLFRDF